MIYFNIRVYGFIHLVFLMKDHLFVLLDIDSCLDRGPRRLSALRTSRSKALRASESAEDDKADFELFCAALRGVGEAECEARGSRGDCFYVFRPGLLAAHEDAQAGGGRTWPWSPEQASTACCGWAGGRVGGPGAVYAPF